VGGRGRIGCSMTGPLARSPWLDFLRVGLAADRTGVTLSRLGTALVVGRRMAPLAGRGGKYTGQPVSRLVGLAQRSQVGCKIVRRDEGVGVVLAKDAAAPGQGVLVEYAGLLMFAQLAQVGREPACRSKG
jgi:hypothetical protein